MSIDIPAPADRLLHLPLFGALGTVRPDGSPQVNPMWFLWDGEHVRFTHTTRRAKYRNLKANPAMSFMLIDPANPFRYLELRGRLVEEIPDPDGAFYVTLQNRYGNDSTTPPADRADRVILGMSVEKVVPSS